MEEKVGLTKVPLCFLKFCYCSEPLCLLYVTHIYCDFLSLFLTSHFSQNPHFFYLLPPSAYLSQLLGSDLLLEHFHLVVTALQLVNLFLAVVFLLIPLTRLIVLIQLNFLP